LAAGSVEWFCFAYLRERALRKTAAHLAHLLLFDAKVFCQSKGRYGDAAFCVCFFFYLHVTNSLGILIYFYVLWDKKELASEF